MNDETERAFNKIRSGFLEDTLLVERVCGVRRGNKGRGEGIRARKKGRGEKREGWLRREREESE